MSEKKKIGSYEVVKTIGRGSFGVVTAVKDHQGNMCFSLIFRSFVVKQLDMSCMNYKEKRNVVNELKALIEVSVHPFIVRYKEAFVDDCILCVAMDFCPSKEIFIRLIVVPFVVPFATALANVLISFHLHVFAKRRRGFGKIHKKEKGKEKVYSREED
ncbi:NIMA related kinase 2, putative (NEK2) [Plasmodium ovale curtisi]|uniref:non-specific serine/threonine protein kinase n=1 Tax=Plasmodium ovale curtisi TaxID=864141 RepID=A0A1A8VXY7_PLAOA|nr:NIMA related kinase 2, putative (NEK2) [Plasmodium ovale curtisi]